MILIGHSFGAWILYSAISGFLIEDLSANRDVRDEVTPGERFADMVVLINPAFDGARYEPLHRVANCKICSYDKYEPPILVSVTSKTDWALGWAFPLGRFFMTIFQKPTSSDKQSEAISKTLGHIDRYITHDLTMRDKNTPECNEWEELSDEEQFRQLKQLKDNVLAEKKNAEDFFKRELVDKKLKPGWQRTFCGGAMLTHLAGNSANSDPNSTVWNIRADESIIDGHNDIHKPVFSNFIRQLYHDVTQNPGQ
jgi:hypothetical protein